MVVTKKLIRTINVSTKIKFKFFKKILNTTRPQNLLSWHNGLIFIGKMATIDNNNNNNNFISIALLSYVQGALQSCKQHH